MNLTLNWDLFIIIFFAIVIAYTFIIGKKETVKIITATYIAIVAVQAIGSLLEGVMGQTASVGEMLSVPLDLSAFSALKLILFIAIVITFAVKSGLNVAYKSEGSMMMNGLFTGLLGFATAGLMLSILLTYISGVPFLGTTPVFSASPMSSLIVQSQMMQLLIANQAIWLSFPALLLITIGFFNNKE